MIGYLRDFLKRVVPPTGRQIRRKKNRPKNVRRSTILPARGGGGRGLKPISRLSGAPLNW